VSGAFPSSTRPVLTEMYLCHACSCHEIEDGNAWTGRARLASCSGCAASCKKPARTQTGTSSRWLSSTSNGRMCPAPWSGSERSARRPQEPRPVPPPRGQPWRRTPPRRIWSASSRNWLTIAARRSSCQRCGTPPRWSACGAPLLQLTQTVSHASPDSLLTPRCVHLSGLCGALASRRSEHNLEMERLRNEMRNLAAQTSSTNGAAFAGGPQYNTVARLDDHLRQLEMRHTHRDAELARLGASIASGVALQPPMQPMQAQAQAQWAARRGAKTAELMAMQQELGDLQRQLMLREQP
jgi:hypothetical protein